MTRDRDDRNASTEERLQTTRLQTPRMNCPWNARRIADYLQRVEGVVETLLKPRSEIVIVKYDPTRTSEAAITAAVESPPSETARDSTRSRSGRRSSGCQCRCRNQPR